MLNTVDNCRLLDLPRVYDERGSLTMIYNQEHIPFDVARTYYLYDIPGGSQRGGHAHYHLQQLIVSVIGAFDVTLDDGDCRKTIRLERAYFGLYVPTMIWRELANFSSGAICLVLASLPYAEAEYIRDYEEFRRQRNGALPLS